MSVVSCNACGRSVSEEAVSCPHCGQPNPGLQGLAKLFDSYGAKKPSSYVGINPKLVEAMQERGLWP